MKSNLYTATGSWATGQTNQMDYVQIAQVPAATLLANGLSDPYLMGYVEHDKMPGFCKIGHPVNDGKNFHVDYVEENHGFGFCTLANNEWFSHAIKKDGTLLTGANNYYARFINSGTMASANYNLRDSDTIQLSYVGICEPLDYANDNVIFDSSDSGTKFVYVSGTNWIITCSELLNAITNNGYLTLTINNVFGATRTFKIHPDDHNEYNLYSVVDDLNEIKMYFHFNFIVAIPQQTTYVRANLLATDTLAMMPFFQSSFVSDANSALDPDIKIMTGMLKTRTYGDLRLQYDRTTELFTVTWVNFRAFDRYFIGNIPYNVDVQEIFDADTTQTTPFSNGKCGVVAGKFMYRALDNVGSFNIFTSYTIDDIYNLVFILHKHTIASGATNAELYTYANKANVSLFDSDNKPLYIYENGTATDPDFMAKLQPWQYPDAQITLNEFKPEDVPEYNPPTPGENGENVGDNILRPSSLGIGGTNGFVTQYALRAADVRELGEILWTSVFEQDYWQNYLFSLALDTGSFSTSALLSFFVSLKVYPFALINVPSYDDIGKNMYIGTGIKALEFTNNLHTINNYCDYISGGECTVWSVNFFNDYRDYINATYTLYVPYCGTIELNPGDVVHSTLKVQYAVDFATGGCVAYVDVTTHDGAQFTIAALPGQMGADVPLTATAAGAVASRFIGDAMKFGGLISGEVSQVAGGIAAGMSGQNPGGGSGNILSGMAGMVGGLPAAMGINLAPGIAMQAANMMARGAVAAPMMSGGQGFASFGAPQTPYVQIRRGIYPDITGLSTVCGKRGAGTYTVGDLSGFVQGDVKTDGLSCPENEKQKIRRLLAGGIYV